MSWRTPRGVCKRCRGTGEIALFKDTTEETWVVCGECGGDGKSGEPGDGREED